MIDNLNERLVPLTSFDAWYLNETANAWRTNWSDRAAVRRQANSPWPKKED